MDLKELLPLLSNSKVLKFKSSEFEIEFQANVEAPQQSLPNPEVDMPADLRADDLMNEKKIMEWSAPPSAETENEPPMPLTGEAPLTGEP